MDEKRLVSSEMPISEDGRTYHLGLCPEDNLPQNIFLVGDPDRALKVSKYFDFDAEPMIRRNREFITIFGSYQGLPVVVISTGIGPDNMEIVATELYILNEYDNAAKNWKERSRPLNIIRLGTCAALQKNIPVGSLAISRMAIGLDNLGRHYPFYSDSSMVKGVDRAINKLLKGSDAYVAMSTFGMQYFLTEGCKKIGLQLQTEKGYYCGITISAPGFYGPQDRPIGRLPHGPFVDSKNALADFQCYALKNINMEMESAIMFRILGEILNYRVGTICAVLANRQTEEVFSPEEHDASIDRCIRAGLEAMKLIGETLSKQ